MEQRTKVEYKVYLFITNDMRSSKVEYSKVFAIASSKEALENFIRNETVEFYKDDRWGKVFKKGGPLEWANEPLVGFDQGIIEYWGSKEEIQNTKLFKVDFV